MQFQMFTFNLMIDLRRVSGSLEEKEKVFHSYSFGSIAHLCCEGDGVPLQSPCEIRQTRQFHIG